MTLDCSPKYTKSKYVDFFPFLTEQKDAKYKMGTFADSDDYDSELDRDDLNEKLEKIGEDGVKKLQQFESYQKQVEEHGLLPRNDLERRQKADAAKRMKHLEGRRIQIAKMKEVKRGESGKEKPNTPGEVHYQRISTQLKEHTRL